MRQGCAWVWEVCIYIIEDTCTRNEKQGEFINEYKGNFFIKLYTLGNGVLVQ